MISNFTFTRNRFTRIVFHSRRDKFLLHLLITNIVTSLACVSLLLVKLHLRCCSSLLFWSLPSVFSLWLIKIIKWFIFFCWQRSRPALCTKLLVPWQNWFFNVILTIRLHSHEFIWLTILCRSIILKESLSLSVYCFVSRVNISSDWLVMLKEVLTCCGFVFLALIQLIQRIFFLEEVLRVLSQISLTHIFLVKCGLSGDIFFWITKSRFSNITCLLF